MSTTFNHENTAEAVCPHCGHEQSLTNEWFDDTSISVEMCCESCGQKMITTRQFNIVYSTRKPQEITPLEHHAESLRWRKVGDEYPKLTVDATEWCDGTLYVVTELGVCCMRRENGISVWENPLDRYEVMPDDTYRPAILGIDYL